MKQLTLYQIRNDIHRRERSEICVRKIEDDETELSSLKNDLSRLSFLIEKTMLGLNHMLQAVVETCAPAMKGKNRTSWMIVSQEQKQESSITTSSLDLQKMENVSMHEHEENSLNTLSAISSISDDSSKPSSSIATQSPEEDILHIIKILRDTTTQQDIQFAEKQLQSAIAKQFARLRECIAYMRGEVGENEDMALDASMRSIEESGFQDTMSPFNIRIDTPKLELTEGQRRRVAATSRIRIQGLAKKWKEKIKAAICCKLCGTHCASGQKRRIASR